MWHAWNVDRLYMAGVQIKHRAHAGLNHQKSVILYDQDAAPGNQTMVIFGSSNWTSPSAAGQVEHNIFTTKPYITSWFIDQFERKWNNLGGIVENVDFVPLPPDAPKNPVPAVGADQRQHDAAGSRGTAGRGRTSTTFISTPIPTRRRRSPSTWRSRRRRPRPAPSATRIRSCCGPAPRTTGSVVGKTMALQGRSSPVWSFTTAGSSADCTVTSTATAVPTSPCSARRVVTWYSARTSTGGYDYAASELPVGAPRRPSRLPGDFDGDGRSSIIALSTGPRTAAGISAIRRRATALNQWAYFQWGLSSRHPGRRPTSTATAGPIVVVFRPSDWRLVCPATSSPGYAMNRWAYFQWGLATDIPVVGRLRRRRPD